MNAKQFIPKGINAAMLRRWINHGPVVHYEMPDMTEVRCVFTREPIGEETFACIKRRNGDRRIVLCLASCVLDDRYMVVTPQNARAVTVFKQAVTNMANGYDASVDRLSASKRAARNPEANRRSSRELAVT